MNAPRTLGRSSTSSVIERHEPGHIWPGSCRTLNWIVHTAFDLFFVLALKGGSFEIGTGACKTGTGKQPYTGVGFQPKGVTS
jgi:hypothetical protein